MIFNLEKNNNRNLLDSGDIESFLMKLTIINRKIDKPTLTAIVALLNYIVRVFNEKQPKEKIVYPLAIPDGFLNKEVKRILKKNKKLSKNNIAIEGLDTEDDILLPCFTADQLEQLNQIMEAQNEALKKIYEESLKNIKINVTAPASNIPKAK